MIQGVPWQHAGFSVVRRTTAMIRDVVNAASCLLVAAPSALAGRPLQTEDAGVLEPRSCEVEGATLRTRAAGVTARDSTLALACGFGLSSQAGIAISRSQASGERARAAELFGKTRLRQGQGDETPALTLAWALGMSRTDGAAEGWQQANRELNLVYSAPAGPGSVHLNLGHARDQASRLRSTTWGAAYEHEGVDAGGVKWQPMAELFGDDREGAWWNLALRATVVPDRVFVDLSYGRQFTRERATLVTAGLKFTF